MELTKNYIGKNPLYDKYIQDISTHKILTFDQECALAKRIKIGDKKALDELITCNLRFVVLVAKQYQGSGIDIMDLIADGNEGLIIAASKFDPSRKFKFVSFAVWYIRQSITTALSTQSRIVRLPLNRLANIRKVTKARDRLLQILGHEASIDMIADETGLSIEVVSESIRMTLKYTSIDGPINTNESGSKNLTLIDVLESPLDSFEDLASEETVDLIKKSLSTLNKKDCTVLSMFYGIGYTRPLTTDEITTQTGLTKERARQIKERGLRRLRSESRSKILKNLPR